LSLGRPSDLVGARPASQLASLPLNDPHSGDFVGLSSVVFSPVEIQNALREEETPLGERGLHILVSTKPYLNGDDTVMSPELLHDNESPSRKLLDLLIENTGCNRRDDPGCDRLENIAGIVSDMQAGNEGQTQFKRYPEESEEEELVLFAYAPVNVTSVLPVDPSNFSRGVRTYTSSIYSLGLARSEETLQSTFSDLLGTVGGALGVMSFLIFVEMMIIIYAAVQISISVTRPVAHLRELVDSANRGEFLDSDTSNTATDGSSEVTRVRLTFERLFTIMKFANTAFYSGELQMAYDALLDALDLFVRLDNQKAVGIANNNLGNIMLTMYRTMKHTGVPTMCDMTKSRVVKEGFEYFKRTIDSGEEALAKINEEEGWSTNYLVFMQQLSNRYFNRAIFLLTVRDDFEDPQKAEEQGLMDLATCKDMDREVIDNGDKEGFKGEQDVYFELLLGRIRGLVLLMKMGYVDEWGLEELFKEARVELVLALRDENHVLFRDLKPAGQMQRLDLARMEYYRLTRQHKKAGEVGIRMLMEDEYVIAEAASLAIKCVIDVMKQCDMESKDLGGMDPSDLKSILFRYRNKIGNDLSNTRQIGKNLVRRTSFFESQSGHFAMECY